MSTLKSMSKREAKDFEKVCDYSIMVNYDEEETPPSPIIVIELDGSGGGFNGGDLSVSSLGVLDSLGLIDMSLANSETISPAMTLSLQVGHDIVVVENESVEAIKIIFSHAIFLPIGEELAKVCGIGKSSHLRNILETKLSSLGLKTTWIDDFEKQ